MSPPAFLGWQPVLVSVAMVEGSNPAATAVVEAVSMNRFQSGGCMQIFLQIAKNPEFLHQGTQTPLYIMLVI